jgi:hypothetical protein
MLKIFENLQHKIDFKLEIKNIFKKASYLMKSHYIFYVEYSNIFMGILP